MYWKKLLKATVLLLTGPILLTMLCWVGFFRALFNGPVFDIVIENVHEV